MAEQRKIAIPSFEIVKHERERLKKRKLVKRKLTGFFELLIVIAAVAVIVATRYLPVLQISGFSMEPTLEEGEIVVLVKTQDVKAGDIVGFYHQNKILIKRIIGNPGDLIDIKDDGTVTVNGVDLEEPYITKLDKGKCDVSLPCQVPQGQYFVMGDHRATSADSRISEIGCVPKEQLVGKVKFRIWPLQRVKVFNKESQ